MNRSTDRLSNCARHFPKGARDVQCRPPQSPCRASRPHSRLLVRGRRGSASALIVLMLVVLVFFGVLSVVTAAADNRLASRRASWVKTYFDADKSALQVMGSLNNFASMSPPAQAGDRIALLAAMQLQLKALPGVEMLEADLEAGEDLRFRVWTGDQAIEVGLRVNDPTPGKRSFQNDITRWTAWQKPFDYDNAGGGVWKGDL